MKKTILTILISLFTFSLFAQDFSIVAVGDATLEKDKIVISEAFGSDALGSQSKSSAVEFTSVLRSDFKFYKKRFDVLSDMSRSVKTEGDINFDFWKSKKVSFVVRVNVFEQGEVGSKLLKAKIQLFNINSSELISESEDILPNVKLREVAHTRANELYQSITGKKSIFNSKIYFVSDKTGTRSEQRKELYRMDFDGKNIVQLTFHKGTVISPSISHDQTKLLYSLIKNSRSKKRNINLYMLDLKTNKSTLLSSKKGINSGAIFTHDDKSIILTLSHRGNAELYKMNLATKSLQQITRHYSADVDPSISRDGRLMAFLSDRPGKAMIYTLNPSGIEKSVRRISFVGQYNATPRFSPDGKEIAFSSWLDNRFDIFRIGADGRGLSRLTKDFGSNEDPTYSNDGQFIAFSSQRVLSRTKAVQNIYIMDRDGEIIGQITSNFGNCITPRWSK